MPVSASLFKALSPAIPTEHSQLCHRRDRGRDLTTQTGTGMLGRAFWTRAGGQEPPSLPASSWWGNSLPVQTHCCSLSCLST